MKRNIKRIGVVVLTILFVCTSCCFATSIESSKLVTGTKNLLEDLTNWLLGISLTLSAFLIMYYLARKSMSDETDSKRWENRVKVSIICLIGITVASGLIKTIVTYYQ